MMTKTLATKKEHVSFGSLGFKFECEDMISQLKVMYDNISPSKERCDDQDEIRLHKIKEEIIQAILTLEIIDTLSK